MSPLGPPALVSVLSVWSLPPACPPAGHPPASGVGPRALTGTRSQQPDFWSAVQPARARRTSPVKQAGQGGAAGGRMLLYTTAASRTKPGIPHGGVDAGQRGLAHPGLMGRGRCSGREPGGQQPARFSRPAEGCRLALLLHGPDAAAVKCETQLIRCSLAADIPDIWSRADFPPRAGRLIWWAGSQAVSRRQSRRRPAGSQTRPSSPHQVSQQKERSWVGSLRSSSG